MNKQIDTEEKKYEQFRRLGQKLHIPTPEHSIELEVRDKNGNIIQRHKQRSHSWVRNAYNMLLSQMASKALDDAGVFGAGLLNIKATNGIIYDLTHGAAIVSSPTNMEDSGRGYRAPGADNTYGIQVGSGVNAESFEDFVLQTLIAEGVGAGQLNYILSEVPAKGYNAGTRVWTITLARYMNNNSGGDVDVNEVGLTTKGVAGGGERLWIMSRDHLASTVTVPDTGQLKVTYSIQLTYPA